MGNESSQLQKEAAEAAEDEQRGGRVIGTPMSPSPPPYPGEVRDLRKPRGFRTDGGDDARSSDSDHSKSIKKKKKKEKKKKKKRRDSLDSDAANGHLDATTAAMADENDAPAAAPESHKKSRSKKKSRNKEPNGVQSPDAQHLLVSHAVGGSPPSGQQPDVNGIAGHAPTLDIEVAEQELIPASSVEDIASAHLKTEPDTDVDDVQDHELPFRIAGIADDSIVDGDDPSQKSPFMHKREMSIVDDRLDRANDDEAATPDLQPSQVKPEPPSSESESDLGSPSVARLDRLERSRSRSISRPPLVKPAIESFDAGDQATLPSRSSTGSNKSIPARTQDARPTSRDSAHSSSWHNAQQSIDAMDLDVDDQGFANGHVSPPEKQARKAKSAKKPKSHKQAHKSKAEAGDADERPDAPASSRKRSAQKGRQHQSDNPMLNTDVDKVANWLQQPARRRTHEDVVEESDHEAADQSAEAVVHNGAQDELQTEEAIQRELQQQLHTRDTEARADKEPEVSATQPKKAKKKRQLHSKESLSLSQLEDDFGEGDNQPRVSLSQRSKLKDVMRGERNSPEDETGTNVEPSQEPSLPKQAKLKRKRRSNGASEDELEDLLAGPSKRKKSKKSSKGLDPSDRDRAAVASRRKRSSQGEIATGPWTSEELVALGRVVDQFCKAYDMEQSELNDMIHQRPEMTNPLHKEFWDNAVAAIDKRTRRQIVERTRRLYNNFVGRGRWDEEQKEQLHDLFDKHGTKFAAIASLINRDQKDIRDYWRNHYVVDGHQRKSRWKPDETEMLKQAVEEALNKIRIDRENNDQFRPRPRAKGFDDESLLDWQQISAAMGLTRNRQQCKFKWQDLKDKGVVGDGNDHLPEASRESKTINGMSEVLANAREDYRVMSVDDQLQVIEAIHDSGATSDSKIRWNSLVDERFRAKWRRPSLKLVWFRLRKTVPDHEEQDVQSNARYLLNYYNVQQSLPRIEDHQADEQVEEKLVNTNPGSKVWRTPSQEPRAVRERQRRSSSASSRASSRASEKVSSQILRIPGNDDDEHGEPAQRGRDHTPRSGSLDLGQEDVEGAEKQQHRKKGKGKGKRTHGKKRDEAVPIRIPEHLNGEAAEKASAEPENIHQSSAGASKAKGKTKSKAKKAKSPPPPRGGWRSESVAMDSDSE
ncbi:hypothetical protein INS49_014026 [Diaporthe citri]|uniref:uncharacterized protein n=1 Tax=Diaporthe citri TaxID=83186 RepID=UPI001C81713E|nr:uncharacterized protein INS49_014026 [Diaporthe citri]KAG6358142.1 hypothetical protein INS49_014026 [Diaporthe citri]